MNIQEKAKILSLLGDIMLALSTKNYHVLDHETVSLFEESKRKAQSENGWFTDENIRYAFNATARMLNKDDIVKWLMKYEKDIEGYKNARRVGVIMAGNIPAVGFHDLLCVLASGNKILIKTSKDDKHLIRFVADQLIRINKSFEEYIEYTDSKLSGFDAVIATGSNNTSRYFDYYFGKYPNIIRRNMNGLAVLTGNESDEDLIALGNDIFRYYGLGCRNVSSILVPDNYNLELLTKALSKWDHISDNNKYHNNYVYYRTLAAMNSEKYYDGGFYIMKNSASIVSPLSVIHIIPYKNLPEVKDFIKVNTDKIQCVVCRDNIVDNSIKPGESQQPKLWDYADNMDTMTFLLSL